MKLNVIMSIKPKYVKEIINGNKKYEYRKSVFKKEVEKVYIYSTSPQQRIIGYFNYTGYLKDTPQKIWDKTKKTSGIIEEEYYKYYDDSSYAYAIKIEHIYVLSTPINPKSFNKFSPPQSHMYIEGEL